MIAEQGIDSLERVFSRRIRRVLAGWVLLSIVSAIFTAWNAWEGRITRDTVEARFLERCIDITFVDYRWEASPEAFLSDLRVTQADLSDADRALGLQRFHTWLFPESIPAFNKANRLYERELNGMSSKNVRAFVTAFRWWASLSLGALAAALATLLGFGALASAGAVSETR